MGGTIIAFIGWCLCGLLFVGVGISAFFAKKPAGFWANAKTGEVTDVKKYNKAVGIMFCIFGIVFSATGLPLLVGGQNSPWVVFTMLGVMLEAIVMMVVYTVVIEKKYRK